MPQTGNYLVRVRFDPEVADRVRERIWHESQEMTDLAEGRLELTMRLGALAEVESWILGWGRQAEVIEPKELRMRLTTAAEGLLAVYKRDPAAARKGRGESGKVP